MFCVDGNLTHLPGKKLWEKSLVKSGQKEGGSGPPFGNSLFPGKPGHKFLTKDPEAFSHTPSAPQESCCLCLVHSSGDQGCTAAYRLKGVTDDRHHGFRKNRKTFPWAQGGFAQIALNPDFCVVSGMISRIGSVTDGQGARTMAATNLLFFLGR